MVATLSLILSGSIALLSGGGAHIVTRSHYQRRLRELEARLRELRSALRAREAELEATQTELVRVSERLADRERRLEELAANIGAVREVTIDLDQRLTSHGRLARRALAALTLRISEHHRESEALRERLSHATHALDDFEQEETTTQVEVIDLQAKARESERQTEKAQAEVAEREAEVKATEAEIQSTVNP